MQLYAKAFGFTISYVIGCAVSSGLASVQSTRYREVTTMTYIEELQDVISRLHGSQSIHIESVPIKETFQGKTVWEGIVEVFDL